MTHSNTVNWARARAPLFASLVVVSFGCGSQDRVTNPSNEARFDLRVVFATSTVDAAQTRTLTFVSHARWTDLGRLQSDAASFQVIDQVTVTVSNSNSETVVDNQQLSIVDTPQGRVAEGSLSIPVSEPGDFVINVKAFENGVLVFAGSTVVTLSPGANPSDPVQVTLQPLGTGDVQITLTWNNTTDQDLHVIDPDNTRIFFDNKTSPSGGSLDFDDRNGFGPENIFWPQGGAPSGLYRVQVVYFSGVGATDVTVVVSRSDATTQTFNRVISVVKDTLNITEFNFVAAPK